VLRRLALALSTLALLAPPALAAPSDDPERLSGANGAPLFVTGINYEGPADRAWQMWENDKFEPAAIASDFHRAASAGINTIRLFVQAPLAAEIGAGKWDKLDQVVGLAEKESLQLIVSLHDYGERDLGKIAATAGQIAQRYRGRPGVLALDLKNEPRFGDLALGKYPSPPPLQQRAVIEALGERLARADVTSYRTSDEGARTVPSYLSDDQAWVYVNYLRLYREMLAAAAEWVKAGGYKGTTLDYLDDPAGQSWRPLLNAVNGTLEAWLGPQLQAIRTADPDRSITVDHVDVVLASLPANDALDFQSLHRYPSQGAASVRANLRLIATLQRAHPMPYLLSEFGYATETVDPERAALHETAIMLGLLGQRAAGGAKWMLNDMPPGYNQRERTLGAFKADGGPKPVAAAFAALRGYVSTTGATPGDLKLDDDPDSGLRYVYRASDALLLGGKKVDGGAASFQAGGPAQLFLTWSEPNVVRVWASSQMQATVDLAQLTGGQAPGEVALARLDGGKEQARPAPPRSGNVAHLTLDAGTYLLRLGAAPNRGPDYAIGNGRFFTQTNGHKDSVAGFTVSDEGGVPLWTAFQALGGVDVLGYPVTRRFEMDGFTVQAFQKAVLQWRPEQKSFNFLNTFDVLHDRGRDDWLETYRQTPRPQDTAPDAGLPWPRVVARHVALLDSAPAALKEKFLSDPQWVDHYGLPVSVHEFSNSVVVRAQRATLQYWKDAVPWAAKGSVSVANGGDLAKEAGLFPWLAVTPENAPR
jgi:hypothetical protein